MDWNWSHATNSHDEVVEASNDPNISAVECDILLGVANEEDTSFYNTPILAHPPNKQSDISFASLLLQLARKEQNGARVLKKHLKFDFKEIDAVEPSLDRLQLTKITNPLKKTIFLNADILPGPGKREEGKLPVPPGSFLSICMDHIRSQKDKSTGIIYSFSLGYRCDYSKNEPYLALDAMAMSNIVKEHGILSGSGIGLVLALNARCLARQTDVFDDFLRVFPESSILAWTGSGDPGIPKTLIDKICLHFEKTGMRDRISFDCDVLL